MEAKKGYWRTSKGPNTITLSRLVLFHLSLLGFALIVDGVWVFVCYLLSVGFYASDSIDGWWARKNNATSPFGQLLDAGCDKPVSASAILFTIAFAASTMTREPHWYESAIAVIIVFIWVLRDVGVTFFRVMIGAKFPTLSIGKFRTVIAGLHYAVVLAWFAYGMTNAYIIAGVGFIAVSIWASRGEKPLRTIAFLFITLLYPPLTAPIGLVAITVYTLWRYAREFRDEMEHNPGRLWRKLSKPLGISTGIAVLVTTIFFVPLFAHHMLVAGGLIASVYLLQIVMTYKRMKEKPPQILTLEHPDPTPQSALQRAHETVR